MSETKTQAKAEAAPEVTPNERAYPVETLRSSSVKLFGVTTSTFDGAMCGQTEPLTVSDAKGIIEKWKKGAAR
jgi:hypothetical protein